MVERPFEQVGRKAGEPGSKQVGGVKGEAEADTLEPGYTHRNVGALFKGDLGGGGGGGGSRQRRGWGGEAVAGSRG